MSIVLAQLALAAQLFAPQAGQDPPAPAPPPPQQQLPSLWTALSAAQGTAEAAQQEQMQVLLQQDQELVNSEQHRALAEEARALAAKLYPAGASQGAFTQAQQAQAYAEQHRALAEEAREQARAAKVHAELYAAGAGRGEFMGRALGVLGARIAGQDSEAELRQAIEEARRQVERLQRDLERRDLERRQAAKRPAEILLRGEQIQLDHLDPEQLQELQRRIGAALERRAEGEQAHELHRRWKVEAEQRAPELRSPSTPGAPGAAPRIIHFGTGRYPVETIIEDEQDPLLSTRPRTARTIVRGGETRSLTPEAPRARVSAEPAAKAVEILRLKEEKQDGASKPARIVVRRDGAEEQEVEVEELSVLGRLFEPTQARRAYPAPPTPFDPRAPRIDPRAEVAPAPDTQEALLEVTSLVREMVREVRELRSSLEELRAQVHGSGAGH